MNKKQFFSALPLGMFYEKIAQDKKKIRERQ